MNRLPSLLWRLAFISIILIAITLGARLYSMTRTLGNTFRYDCTIKAVDGETRQPLRITAANGPSINSKDLFNQSYATAFTRDGDLKIAGIAYEPRQVMIVVDGYRAVAVTIHSATPSVVEVPMKRGAAGGEH